MCIALRFLAVCAAGLLGPVAQAQVLRCTDARTGQVTYTDGRCGPGTQALEVQPRKTPEEIRQEREQAAQAVAAQQQRQQAAAAAARLDAERDAQQRRAQADRAARAGARDYARSPECVRARRSLDMAASAAVRSYGQDAQLDAAQWQMDLDCLGPEGYAEVQRYRAAPPGIVLLPPPRYARPVPVQPVPAPTFTQCNVFRCFDAQGRSYSRP
ncbi:DUF4124 domain-containing protein [Acidovorax sp. SRB_24]|uniref:DUF4124 domain-containing protein n=1 Tax=Acidovorax sp. SRB_24 TaxID=1962700 RepID=UPI00145F287B|nr:DUF4124 domain-containing protein [Acidovorax sp. SRB_24]NMM78979.1 hypothetical protein [Acidovorax sp. SRB_24]